MKKIAIALLLILVTAYPAYARWSVGTAGGAAAGGEPSCVPCTTSNDSDVFASGITTDGEDVDSYYHAYKFTIAGTKCITGGRWEVRDSGSEVTVVMQIQTDSSGSPSGSLVGAGYTSTVTSFVDGTRTTTEFPFSATQTLSAGTYWMVFHPTVSNITYGYDSSANTFFKYDADGDAWGDYSGFPGNAGVLGCDPS